MRIYSIQQLKSKFKILKCLGKPIIEYSKHYGYLMINNNKFSLYNGNTYLEVHIGCLETDHAGGEIIVPFKPVYDIISKLKADSVKFNITTDSLEISTNNGKGSYFINKVDLDLGMINYTRLTEKCVKTKLSAFTSVLDSVGYAVDSKNSRVAFKYVYFGENHVCGTDAYKLGVLDYGDPLEQFKGSNFYLSINDLNVLSEIGSFLDIDLDIRTNGKTLEISNVFFILAITQPEVKFPTITRLINIYNECFIKVNNGDLIKAIEEATVINKETSSQAIKFKVGKENNLYYKGEVIKAVVPIPNIIDSCLEKDTETEFDLNFKDLLSALKTYPNDSKVILNFKRTDNMMIIISNEDNSYLKHYLASIKE